MSGYGVSYIFGGERVSYFEGEFRCINGKKVGGLRIKKVEVKIEPLNTAVLIIVYEDDTVVTEVLTNVPIRQYSFEQEQ